MIGYGRQSIDESDIAAVVQALRSDHLTQGPIGEGFESALCDYTGAKYAVAVSSGAAALFAVYAALGLQKGKMLWTSPITFVATANAASLLGADVEFVEIDPKTGNLCIKYLAEKLLQASARGTLPDVVVPVHLTGRSCDMEPIHKLSIRYGFRIVEDAAHALGGSYHQNKIGSCKFSDATILSFHPLKSITTGEGGAILTNNCDVAEAAREIRHHGITRTPSKFLSKNEPGFHYEQHRMGFNLRLSDLHAALGVSQLKRLDHFISIRREIVESYYSGMSGKTNFIELPEESNFSAWHLFAVKCENKRQRDGLYSHLLAEKIGTAVHYPPVYRQPWYQKNGNYPELPLAERYADIALSLPLHPMLSNHEIKKVIDQVMLYCQAD